MIKAGTSDTSSKGDIGVAKIIADLTSKGIKIALPISAHLPFDLIAIAQDARLSRVSVKYVKKHKCGALQIPLRTIAHNSCGRKIKLVDFTKVDAYAVYCPDNDCCYYISKDTFGNRKSMLTLRIDESNLNIKTIRWAKEFMDSLNLFKFI